VSQPRRIPKTNAASGVMRDDELIAAAAAARSHSYSPYSKYAVGAAVLAKSGQIYFGTNVENASYPLTICAERAAVFAAVSHGERAFLAIAVVTVNGGTPCGACRQVLAEFHVPRIIVADTHRHKVIYSLAELLPHSFAADKLPR
jgi:cytidine deaminase